MTKFKIVTNYTIFVVSNMQQFLNDAHRWRCRQELKSENIPGKRIAHANTCNCRYYIYRE